jgi:hypothetical protein
VLAYGVLRHYVTACIWPPQAEGRPDAAGRGGPATLLSVGERWAAQLSAMGERAKAALHHCAEIPLVQANATALLNLLKGDPSSSVLMSHPSKVQPVVEPLFYCI